MKKKRFKLFGVFFKVNKKCEIVDFFPINFCYEVIRLRPKTSSNYDFISFEGKKSVRHFTEDVPLVTAA